MPTQLLLVTEAHFDPTEATAAARRWSAHLQQRGANDRGLFRSLDNGSVLELTALPDINALKAERGHWQMLWDELSPAMVGDVRRQVLDFVEAPKSTDALLPETPYVQLRHVEIRPPVYDRYRTWRDRTIFSVVRRSQEVDVFLAYHSLLSTEPGVMFVAGFTCEPEKYLRVFQSPEYQEIVRQAGDEFITGGEHGLYTKVFARVTG